MTSPRLSIVTVSFNQRRFLTAAIESVLGQDYGNLEYIVVDPGSTDGSREIVSAYADRIDTVVLEQDSGPAEGLNNGFRHATGCLLGFLNADDVLLPGALKIVADAAHATHADVLSGDSMMIDADGRGIRRLYSDRYSLKAVVNGGCVLMQPSTFFTAEVFRRVGGFNVQNKLDWDGELWIDMALAGARFTLVPKVLSGYRVHPGTITTSPDSMRRYREFQRRAFVRVVGRSPRPLNFLTRGYYRLRRYALRPEAVKERLLRGPIGER